MADQFPHWADLPITPVEVGGWDNRTFRLGEHLSLRMPSDRGYVPQVDKEHRWLPWLAPKLPLAIPEPVARGVPGHGYPYPWSVYRWLTGRPAHPGHIADMVALATSLAGFLHSLHRLDATHGPPAGAHSGYRGAPLSGYDGDARRCLAELGDQVDVTAAGAVWETALGSTWEGAPAWFHGDMAADNLLLREGRLSAVIDFGCCGVGDPACDLAIAWTLLTAPTRPMFAAAVEADAAAWDRGRGWALWKALITVEQHQHTDPPVAAQARQVIREVISG